MMQLHQRKHTNKRYTKTTKTIKTIQEALARPD
jgi:hypothetical protein